MNKCFNRCLRIPIGTIISKKYRAFLFVCFFVRGFNFQSILPFFSEIQFFFRRLMKEKENKKWEEMKE